MQQAAVGKRSGAVGHLAGPDGDALLAEGRGGRQAALGQQRRCQRHQLATH